MLFLQLPIIFYTSKFPGKPTDESFGLIEKLGLEALINAGDWKAVENKVLQLPSDDLTRVMDGLCKQENLTVKVMDYLTTTPSEFQDVLAGNFHINRAWKIRSGSWAEEVGEDQWEGFFKHLNIAAERLNRTYASKKLELEGIARLIRVYMGGSDKEEAHEAYNHCKEIDPNHYLSNIAMHRILTPRWGGSTDEMVNFAASIDNSHLRGLIELSNLVEIYSDMYNENNDEDEQVTKQRFYKEHDALIDKTLSSLEIPTDNSSMLAIDFKNHLACVYSILNMKKDRDQYLKEVDKNITSRPWCYFGMMNHRDVKLYKMVGMI